MSGPFIPFVAQMPFSTRGGAPAVVESDKSSDGPDQSIHRANQSPSPNGRTHRDSTTRKARGLETVSGFVTTSRSRGTGFRPVRRNSDSGPRPVPRTKPSIWRPITSQSRSCPYPQMGKTSWRRLPPEFVADRRVDLIPRLDRCGLAAVRFAEQHGLTRRHVRRTGD